MKNLVIGSTSQLSHYFPNDYVKISSRDLDFNYLKNNDWDSVYITFAEQRIYDQDVDYISTNYLYTLKVIEALLPRSKKIVCYTSCELWNNMSGYISVSTPPQFYPLSHEYSVSKLLLLNKVIERRRFNSDYNKVAFIHPFYFNSVHRSKYFLFGKIFDSIKHKTQISVGNLNFYRDMVHTKFVVEKSIQCTKDTVVGAGKLFNVREFVRDIYQLNGLKYDDLVLENLSAITARQKLILADVNWDYTYQQLLSETQGDILSWIQ